MDKNGEMSYRVYIGTYTKGRKEGIFLYNLNVATGDFQRLGAFEAEDPSFLAIDAEREYVYAVNEITNFEEKESGSVSAFAIDKETGYLKFINKRASEGGAPCYLTINAKESALMVANYEGGNVSVLPIENDGSLAETTNIRQYKGQGADKERQEAPHAHCIVADPQGKYAFSADLGTDRVYLFKIQPDSILIPNDPVFITTKSGAGPRHICFHPSGSFMYLVNELDNTVSAYTYNQENGLPKELQTVSSLPEGYDGKSQAADLHISPDGRFLYVSNRGHNSIGIFSISQSSGNLNLVGHVTTLGDWPRNFAITATGDLMLIANERSNNIVSYFIDKSSGKLTFTGHDIEVPSPVYLLIVE